MHPVYDTTRILCNTHSATVCVTVKKGGRATQMGVSSRRMTGSLTVPAAVTPRLRRQAIGAYADACEAAHDAAERLIAAPAAEVEAVGAELCRCRVRLLDTEDTLDALADDLAAYEDLGVELGDPRRRARIAALIENTLNGADSRLRALLRALRDDLRR